MTVAEIVLDEALRRWWHSSLALECDRYLLLENLGCEHPAKYCRWGWNRLPQQIKQLLVNYSLSGKPLEFLERNDE